MYIIRKTLILFSLIITSMMVSGCGEDQPNITAERIQQSLTSYYERLGYKDKYALKIDVTDSEPNQWLLSMALPEVNAFTLSGGLKKISGTVTPDPSGNNVLLISAKADEGAIVIPTYQQEVKFGPVAITSQWDLSKDQPVNEAYIFESMTFGAAKTAGQATNIEIESGKLSLKTSNFDGTFAAVQATIDNIVAVEQGKSLMSIETITIESPRDDLTNPFPQFDKLPENPQDYKAFFQSMFNKETGPVEGEGTMSLKNIKAINGGHLNKVDLAFSISDAGADKYDIGYQMSIDGPIRSFFDGKDQPFEINLKADFKEVPLQTVMTKLYDPQSEGDALSMLQEVGSLIKISQFKVASGDSFIESTSDITFVKDKTVPVILDEKLTVRNLGTLVPEVGMLLMMHPQAPEMLKTLIDISKQPEEGTYYFHTTLDENGEILVNGNPVPAEIMSGLGMLFAR